MTTQSQQTLAAAKSYTDDAIDAHEAAGDPHPQYARMYDVHGQPINGSIIVAVAGDSMPPVAPNSVLISPGGIFIPNETSSAWVELGKGPIPSDTTPPSLPSNFRVTTVTTTSITVAWNASTDGETGIGGYDVSINSGAWVSLGNVLTYTFAALTPGTSYAMAVRARDNATNPNVSAAANVSGTTTAVSIAAPQNLRVGSATTTSVTFLWDAPASGTVTSYEWRLAGGTFANNGAPTTKAVTGLTPDTPYTFGVRAVFSNGTTSAEVTTTGRTAAASGGGTSSMYLGIHVIPPSSSDLSNNPELSIYSGMSNLQVLQKVEADMRTLTGVTENPLMSIGHGFHGVGSGYRLSSWANTQLARMPACILNFKPTAGATIAGMQATASGSEDTAIKALITSLPAGKRIYLTYFHEPDETAGAFATAWRAATVHWAKLILDNRGGKDLHPMVCQTSYSFRPANAATQAQFLSVTNDYEAAGIDWQTQVVMGPDGYQPKSTDAGTPPNAATTFQYVYPQLAAAGWVRFGLTETATITKAGTAGSDTVTAADVTNAPTWAKSLIKYAAARNFEYVCWFNTTGSKGPVGSWMYSNAIKSVWGLAAHNRGPDPSW